MKYRIYETFTGKKSVTIHKSTCRLCRSSEEFIIFDDNKIEGVWHGDFNSINKAMEFANLFTDCHIRKCKICNPGNIEKNKTKNSNKFKEKDKKENINQEIVNNISDNEILGDDKKLTYDKTDALNINVRKLEVASEDSKDNFDDVCFEQSTHSPNIDVEKGVMNLSDIEFKDLKHKFSEAYIDSGKLILPGLKFDDLKTEFPGLTMEDLKSKFLDVCFVDKKDHQVDMTKLSFKDIKKKFPDIYFDVGKLIFPGLKFEDLKAEYPQITMEWLYDKFGDVSFKGKTSVSQKKEDSPKEEHIVPVNEINEVEIEIPELVLEETKPDVLSQDLEKPGDFKLNIEPIEIDEVEVKVPKVDDILKVEVDTIKVDSVKVDLEVPKVDFERTKLGTFHPDINLNATNKLSIDPINFNIPSVEAKEELIRSNAEELKVRPVDFNIPKVELSVPEVDLNVPKVELSVPEVDLNVPEVELNIPKAELDVPEVEFNFPKAELNISEDIKIEEEFKKDVEGFKTELNIQSEEYIKADIEDRDVEPIEFDILEDIKIEEELKEDSIDLVDIDVPKIEFIDPEEDINIDAEEFEVEPIEFNKEEDSEADVEELIVEAIDLNVQQDEIETGIDFEDMVEISDVSVDFDEDIDDIVKVDNAEVDFDDIEEVDIYIDPIRINSEEIDSEEIEVELEESISDPIEINMPKIKQDEVEVDISRDDLHSDVDLIKVDDSIDIEPLEINMPKVKDETSRINQTGGRPSLLSQELNPIYDKKFNVNSIISPVEEVKDVPEVEEVKVESTKGFKIKFPEPYFKSGKLILPGRKFKKLKDKFPDLSNEEIKEKFEESIEALDLEPEEELNDSILKDGFKSSDLKFPNLSFEELKTKFPNMTYNEEKSKKLTLKNLQAKFPNLSLKALKAKFPDADFDDELEETVPTIDYEPEVPESKLTLKDLRLRFPNLTIEELGEKFPDADFGEDLTILSPELNIKAETPEMSFNNDLNTILPDITVSEPEIESPRITLKDLKLKFPNLSVDKLKEKFPDADFGDELEATMPLNIPDISKPDIDKSEFDIIDEDEFEAPRITLKDLKLKFPNLSVDKLKEKFPDADFSDELEATMPINIPDINAELEKTLPDMSEDKDKIKLPKLTLKDLRIKFPNMSIDKLRELFPDADFSEDFEEDEEEIITESKFKLPKLPLKDLKSKSSEEDVKENLGITAPDVEVKSKIKLPKVKETAKDYEDISIDGPKIKLPKLTLKDLKLRFPDVSTDKLKELYPDADFSEELELTPPEGNAKILQPQRAKMGIDIEEYYIEPVGDEDLNTEDFQIEPLNEGFISNNDEFFTQEINIPKISKTKVDILVPTVDFNGTEVEDLKLEDLKAEFPDIYTDGETLYLPGIGFDELKAKIPDLTIEQLKEKYPNIKFNAAKIDFLTLKKRFCDIYMDGDKLVLPGLVFKDLLVKFPNLSVNELQSKFKNIKFNAEEINFENLKSKFPDIYMDDNKLVFPDVSFNDLKTKFPDLTMGALREKFHYVIFESKDKIANDKKEEGGNSGMLKIILAIGGILLLLLLVFIITRAISNLSLNSGAENDDIIVPVQTQTILPKLTFEDIKAKFSDVIYENGELVFPSEKFDDFKVEFPDVSMNDLLGLFGNVSFKKDDITDDITFEKIKAKFADATLEGEKLVLPTTSYEELVSVFPDATMKTLNEEFSGGVEFGEFEITFQKIKAEFLDAGMDEEKLVLPSANYEDLVAAFPSITRTQLNEKFPGGIVFKDDDVVVVQNTTSNTTNTTSNATNTTKEEDVDTQDQVTFSEIQSAFPDAKMEGNNLVFPNQDFDDLKDKFPDLTITELLQEFDQVVFNKIGDAEE